MKNCTSCPPTASRRDTCHVNSQRFGLCHAAWITPDGTHHHCYGLPHLHATPCRCACGLERLAP